MWLKEIFKKLRYKYVRMIIYLVIFAICSYFMAKDIRDRGKVSEVTNLIVSTVGLDVRDNSGTSVNISIDFEKLDAYENVVGWLYIPRTQINYPVVQYTDNEYYLKRDIEGRYNNYGWIYMDYRNDVYGNDSNIIIYGHNSVSNTMFGTLDYLRKNSYYSVSYKVYFITREGTYIYQVCSVYEEDSDYGYNVVHINNEYIDKINSKNEVEGVEKAEYHDKLLTLSTCTITGRLVVHCRFVEKV